METHGFGASSYDALSFAQMMGAVNPDFIVAGPNDWKPTPPASTTRTVSVAAGSGAASGVHGRTAAATTLTFGANSGSVNRFDYVIARWNWSIGDVVLMVLPGGTTPPAMNSTQSVNSAQVNRIPGVMYDGIVAQVRVRPGVTQFNADDVIDMRPWTTPFPLALTPASGWMAEPDSGYGAPEAVRRGRQVSLSGMMRRSVLGTVTAEGGFLFDFTVALPDALRPRASRHLGVASSSAGFCNIYYKPSTSTLAYSFFQDTPVYTPPDYYLNLTGLSYFL